AAEGVPRVCRRSSMAAAPGDRVVGAKPERLGGRAPPVLHVDAVDDGRPPSEGVARPGSGADRQRTVEAADAPRYLPRRSGSGVAQPRGRDPDPPGSAVPEDQRRSTVVDRGVGLGTAALDLSDVPEEKP